MPSGPTRDETAGAPGSRLLAEPILVVRRKPNKGRRPDYSVFDAEGRHVAQGVYVSDEEIRPLMRGHGLRHWTAAALRIVDAHDRTVFVIAFPGWRGRSVLLVSDGEKHEVGDAIKTKGFLRMTYELRHGERRIGAIRVLDRRQRRVLVTDDTGAEVALIRTAPEETPATGEDGGEAYSLQTMRTMSAAPESGSTHSGSKTLGLIQPERLRRQPRQAGELPDRYELVHDCHPGP
jgi:hypothetical protein